MVLDASSMPGTSALKVPVGASVIIEIKRNFTLALIGGPGYGRLPGGAGLEVPFGAKCVITGEGKLVATGGDAANGGTGYGGMGGSFNSIRYIDPNNEATAGYLPYDAKYLAEVGDETRDGLDPAVFLAAPLFYGLTGTGGAGGEGGGGAGAAIGARGGSGGASGAGGAARVVTGGNYWEADQARYEDFAKYYGISMNEWYLFSEDDSRIRSDGLRGSDGGAGSGQVSCGEIIFAGKVQVVARCGKKGAGGKCGPFGSTTLFYDNGASDAYADAMVSSAAMTITGLGSSVLSPICGLVSDMAVEGSTLGKVMKGFSGGSKAIGFASKIVNFVLKSTVANDRAVMKKQLWFVGGGGGGGGAGGDTASAAIGFGGAGGGGGGGGGSGFFEMGVASVYTKSGLFKQDVSSVVPPLQLSGHGGRGGLGATPGKNASDNSTDAGGEVRHSKRGEADPWNFIPDETDLLDGGTIAALSWQKGDNIAYSGKGALGGAGGGASARPLSLYAASGAKVTSIDSLQGESNLVFTAFDDRGGLYKTITFRDVYGGCDDSFKETYICGTVVESAPLMNDAKHGENLHFAGYYSEPDGKGTAWFDCFGAPVGWVKLTADMVLYAHWSETLPHGLATVRDGGTLSGGATINENAIYVFKAGRTYTFDMSNETGRPGLAIASNRTVVFCIEKGAKVICRGSKGYRESGPRAGVEVPPTATLIVTGKGVLEAYGGAAKAAGNGGNGDDGDLRSGLALWITTGGGGSGGDGGDGAAAGIGGSGGYGGRGGTSTYNIYTHADEDENEVVKGDGEHGYNGLDGTDGTGCGSVYLLGDVRVTATASAVTDAGIGGAAGAPAYDRHKWIWNASYAAFAGGGGGGGGVGASARGIGGGGGAGGGGGSGASGGYDTHKAATGSIDDFSANGKGGAGGKSAGGATDGGNGGTATNGTKHNHPAEGGAGGAAGASGENGVLYCSLDAAALCSETKDSNGSCAETYKICFGHEALLRRITFESGGEKIGEMNAQIGQPLPALPGTCREILPGYLVDKITRKGRPSEVWYGFDGEPVLDSFPGTDDVTLEVTFCPDVAHMATLPEAEVFTYNGSNHVAFVATDYPACDYIDGVTNAVKAGHYSYDVRLRDNFTIWSDLNTNRVRTIGWQVDKATITNDWVDCNLTYDWSLSPEENAKLLQQKGILGFELPDDDGLWVEARRGDRVQVNVEDLILTVHGGSNYVDRTYYGSYSSAQPLQMLLMSWYPWEEKITINYGKSSIVETDSNRSTIDEFKRIYGDSNVVAQVVLKDADGVTRYVTIDESYTVSDLAGSGRQVASVTIDLRQFLDERFPDGYDLSWIKDGALPIAISIGGQIFNGGTVRVDFTATPMAVNDPVLGPTNFPCYKPADVGDIYPINASWWFTDPGQDRVTGEDAEGNAFVYPLLAIGTAERPGAAFVPRAESGAQLINGEIRWQPTEAGLYMLEHFVTNRYVKGITGYRRAYFDFAGGQQGAKTGGKTVVEVTRKATGATIGYASLADAVANLRYGDTLRVVGNVQMETATIPSGTLLVVDKKTGAIREPASSYLRYDYDTTRALTPGAGEGMRVAYELDEEKARPRFVDPMGFGAGEDGTLFGMTLGNVKPDLYYALRSSGDLATWTVFDRFAANGAEGTLPVAVRAEEAAAFFAADATDDPAALQRFVTQESGGKLTIMSVTGTIVDGVLVIPSEIDGKPVKAIAANAFANRNDIVEVDVASGIESIGNSAFAGCSSLRRVTLAPSVKTIGDSAFSGCAALTSITLHEGLTSIGIYAFAGTGLTELVVPASVTTFPKDVLPSTCKTLRFLGGNEVKGYDTLAYSLLESISGPSSAYYYIPAGCTIFVPVGGTWRAIPSTWGGDIRDELRHSEYWIDFTVEQLSDGTVRITGFGDLPASGRITVPATIDGRQVAELGDGLFKGREDLTEVVLPEGLRRIGNMAFCDCPNLKSLTIPASVEEFGACTFGYIDDLGAVHWSDLESIAFKGEPPDTDFDTYLNPSGTTIVASQGTSGWWKLSTWQNCPIVSDGFLRTTPNADGTVTVSGYDSTKMPADGHVTIPKTICGKTVTALANELFMGCETICAVTIEAAITKIPTRAFDACRYLKSVVLPEGLVSISGSAFFLVDMGGMTELRIPATVTTISESPFYASSITDLYFDGDAPTTFWPGKDITVHARVGTLGWDDDGDGYFDSDNRSYPIVWDGSTFLTSENADGTLTVTGYAIYPQSKGKLRVPPQIEGKMVTAIAAGAFKGGDDLVEVRFPATLERIGANAFESCDSLAILYFGGNAPETEGDLGLNGEKCRVFVRNDTTGWVNPWQGCTEQEECVMVESIASTGKEYINTLVKAVPTLSATMDYMAFEHTGNANLGTFVDDNADWRYFDYSGGPIFDYGSSRIGQTSGNTLDLNVRYVVNVGRGYLAVTNAETKEEVKSFKMTYNGSPRGDNVFVFGGQSSSAVVCTAMRLYSLQLKRDSGVIRDFVPCKNNITDEYGLYDRVEGKFYGNASGYGAFVGPATTAVAQ